MTMQWRHFEFIAQTINEVNADGAMDGFVEYFCDKLETTNPTWTKYPKSSLRPICYLRFDRELFRKACRCK